MGRFVWFWATMLMMPVGHRADWSGFQQWTAHRFEQLSSELQHLSAECRDDLAVYFGQPFQHRWSLAMWDANGRLPSGILSGTFFQPGDFDQCIGLRQDGHAGKYCVLELALAKPAVVTGGDGPLTELMEYLRRYENYSHVTNGLCLPGSCTEHELDQVVPRVLVPEVEWPELRARIKLCQEWSGQLSTVPLRLGQKVVLTLLAVQAVLVAVATVLELAGSQLALVRCFSAVQSTRQLMRIKPRVGEPSGELQLQFIHGIRVISIYWVVLAHVFLFYPFVAYEQPVSVVAGLERRKELIRNPLTHLVVNAGLAVETFFMISGAMTVYTVLPRRNEAPLHRYVLLRWMRFSPALLGAMCLLLLWPRLADGPLMHRDYVDPITEPCYRYWWRSLAYISNLYPSNEACNVIHWYLSADFQLHLLLYLAIYCFYKLPMLSIAYMVLMVVLGLLAPVLIVVLGWAEAPNPSIFLHPTHRFPMEKVDVFVFATYNHLTPYFLGAMLGQLLVRRQAPPRSTLARFLGWWLLMPMMAVLPLMSLGLVEEGGPVDAPLQSAITFSLVRLLWSLALAWLCLHCSQGRAGLLGRLLSAHFWQPLSRLSFALYLIHILSVWHWTFTVRQPLPVSLSSLLFFCLGNVACSTVLAYLLYLLFERPYANLLQLYLVAGRPGKVGADTDADEANNNGRQQHVAAASSQC